MQMCGAALLRRERDLGGAVGLGRPGHYTPAAECGLPAGRP